MFYVATTQCTVAFLIRIDSNWCDFTVCWLNAFIGMNEEIFNGFSAIHFDSLEIKEKIAARDWRVATENWIGRGNFMR